MHWFQREFEMQTFDQAVESSDGKRHVLLGNGFSMACRSDIFSYNALFERADFSTLTQGAKELFELLETTDFEKVIEALKSASKIVEKYPPSDQNVAAQMIKDANALKTVLVSAIAESHPERLNEISDASYANCRNFLNKFERIFTLNYDILTYWAIMQMEIEPQLDISDGFKTPEYGTSPYVVWEIDNNFNQSLYYLHGALHLYDAGSEIQKYTWINTGVKLTEQIRSALDEEKYPIFVAEGTSEEKLVKIKHNAYLTKAFDSFSRITGSLFIYGHSLAPNDEHVLSLVERGRITKLFVGVYGDPNDRENKDIIRRANLMAFRRDEQIEGTRRRNRLEVSFFDALTAKPWG